MMNIYPWGALPFHFVWLIGFGLTDMTWNVPAWSIATEWWTYLIAVPLFPLLNRGISKRTFVLPLLCSAGLWVLISHHKTHTLNITFDFGLVRCLLSFTIGICLYQLYRANHLKQILQKDVALLGAGVLTFLTLHFPNPAYLPPPAPGQFPVANPLTPPFDAISPLVFALLILCAAYNRGLGHRILNAKPLRYLGDISFSVYLMQVTIFILFMGGAGAWRKSHPTGDMDFGTKILLYGVTVLVDILVAAITFRFIEKPARGWFRRMLSTK